METQIRDQLKQLNRANIVLWGAILSGMLILVIAAYLFKTFGILDFPAVRDTGIFRNVFLMIILILLFVILYIKRSLLTAEKITEKAQTSPAAAEADAMLPLVQHFGTNSALLLKTVKLLRRYYLFVWTIADLIVVLGFVEYVLTLNFQSLMIYAIVGLYSLIINYPTVSLLEKCYLKIEAMQS